jgi:predicted nuclease of predicted toxin-antitoxin system
MDLLLDQGLPRSTVAHLAGLGLKATHVGEIGMAASPDETILEFARDHEQVVVSLDSDFHALLASSGASSPSVIRVRVEGLRGEAMSQLIKQVIDSVGDKLEQGAVVSATESSIRVRRLPIGSKPR